MQENTPNVPVVTSAELDTDVHGAFRRCRASHPFAAFETGGYVVLRHDDVRRLCADPRLRATETAVPAQAGIEQGALFDIFHYGMLTANGPVHERRRSVMSRALATQITEGFRQHVRHAAETLVETFRSVGSLDLDSDYAARLPILALGGMLGIEDGEIPTFLHDVYEMNAFFRPNTTADVATAAEAAARRLWEKLETLIRRNRIRRSDGFLSDYIACTEADTQLCGIETLVQIVQLIIGGTESVRTALIAQTANLLSHPSQWEAVRSDPWLVPCAVSESLRFEPAIAGMVRVSSEDIDIDGWRLPAGQLVVLSSLSALRDERVFDRADRFNIFRSDLKPSHLAFGGGPHKCVAEAFGRVELEEGLRALAGKLPGLRLDGLPAFRGHVFVRQTTGCRVSW